MFNKIRDFSLSTVDKATRRANTLFTSMKDKKTDEEKKKRGLGFSIFDKDEEKPKVTEPKTYEKAKTMIEKENQEKGKLQKRADLLYPDKNEESIEKKENSLKLKDDIMENSSAFKKKEEKEQIIDLENKQKVENKKQTMVFDEKDSIDILTKDKQTVKIQKSEPKTLEDAFSSDINPNHMKKYSSNKNCQSTAVVVDLRTRGYDVEISDSVDMGLQNKLSKEPNLSYIDPKTGKAPEMTSINVTSSQDCKQWLDDNIKQNEKHLFVYGQNGVNGAGHAVIVAKDKNGELTFYDGQNQQIKKSEILERIKYNSENGTKESEIKILRVDDKEVNKDIVSKFIQPTRKKKEE